ncbi:PAS/PAC sensor signal transduction histidine kinase [Halorubrum californiense DSM 19288]|uniref:PAS/PAC sensor signal transduction histidine kinase n=1 Tax=Halorubrum californiense DSM 19288 TaxID=1227465 RepID=M0DXV1_9EURY|nr:MULTISPECIES: PAS domain S-box protein [Halorubrum]ELZ40336.1 PAS/PAC sensor signal transduction histidine kinase [Halorubrum californiense DSM 19288]TKX73347.1 PAS domain S-box protein [Halorubrum sp. GN11GM_10-3_MGM]
MPLGSSPPPDDFFASFVEECADPVVSLDEAGTILYANPAAEAALGYEPTELRGRTLASLVASETADERTRSVRERLAEVEGLPDRGSVSVPVRHADGHTVTFSVRFHEHAPGGDTEGRDGGDSPDAAGAGPDAVYTGIFRDGVEEVGGAVTETFRNLVEHAGHAIYVTDADGTIEYVNPAFTDHTGYDVDEALGETPAILNSGEMPDEYFDTLWSTLRDGEVWEEEIVDRRHDGELYHAHQTIAPVADDDGEVSRFVAIQTDITDRKAAMGRLKQYRDVVERLDDPVLLQNRDGEFELLNEAVSEFAGVDRETLYGTDEFAFMDTETAAEVDERRRSVLDAEEMVEYEVSPTFPESGREATFSTQRYPYYDADGELAGTFAICRNVTDRKERERDLERYERAINGATDLIAAVDRDGRLLFANPQYREYHGLGDSDVTDLTLADVVPADSYEDVERQVERALRGESVEYRTTRTHPTRGRRTFDVRYYPLGSPDDGEPAGVVGVLRDVTDSENRARQLRVVDRILQHNLRNALTVVRGRAEQIAAGNVDSADAAEYVLSRADDLLETSEKAHHITEVLSDAPETEPVDVGRIAREVVTARTEEFPHATIAASTPEDGVATASATSWLSRAMNELVRNAVEHHDRDRPTVTVSVEARPDGVEIRVEDDGPGLTGMNRDVLVDGTAVDALYHGSGLGLWLVYWVVQQSGGSAAVADAEPRGTVVTLTFPRADD